MRNWIIAIIAGIFIVLFGYFISEKTMVFVYTNPYTQTSGFPYIAHVLKNVDKVLKETKSSLLFDNKRIKYIYQNPYGSGFLKYNTIPNDLDYAVGIDLGTYNYDEKNAEEIAADLVDKVSAFNFYFISNVYSNSKVSLYSTNIPFGILDSNLKNRNVNISDIADNIENIINDKRYIKYSIVPKSENVSEEITVPYILNSNEILLQRAKQLKLYTDDISYNSKMPHYLRELSVIPEFYVKIKYEGKVFDFELVPEVFPGTRLQLSRRCFGSTVFNRLYSLSFLRNVAWLKDDDTYIYTRLLSFRRHLGEIESLQSLKKSPVKILKRIMQSAEMVRPLLSDKDYEEIVNFVKTNFENNDIQLLNEVLNIYKNLSDIFDSQELYNRLSHTNKIDTMYEIVINKTKELEKSKNINKNTIAELNKINIYIKENILSVTDDSVNKRIDSEIYNEYYNHIEEVIVQQMNACLYRPEQINRIVEVYKKVFTDAGFHKVRFVWLENNKIGVVEDDFTKTIKDFKLMAKENYLVEDAQYVRLTKQQIVAQRKRKIMFSLWIKYNMISQEKADNARLIKKLLADKRNFNIKWKWILIK